MEEKLIINGIRVLLSLMDVLSTHVYCVFVFLCSLHSAACWQWGADRKHLI